MELLQQEQRRGGAGGLCSTAHQRAAAELAYQRRAEQALADENCFKIYVVCMFIMNRFIFLSYLEMMVEQLLVRQFPVLGSHCIAVQT
jgi:hypothetical protein